MLLSSFALSTDSLIVAAALSAVVAPRHIAPLVAWFGISDAGASVIGPMLAVQISPTGLPAAATLLLWGGLIMVNFPTILRWCRSPGLAYLLPPLLAIDNLVVPSAGAAAGLGSSAMAALGFALGFALLRQPVSRMPTDRWIGAALAAAGLFLAV